MISNQLHGAQAYWLVDHDRRIDVLAQQLQALDIWCLHRPVKCTLTCRINMVNIGTIAVEKALKEHVSKKLYKSAWADIAFGILPKGCTLCYYLLHLGSYTASL